MILKKLYDEYDLPIERILLKEYKRLKITMQDMSVLIALFSIQKKRKTFSMLAIARRVEFSQDDIGRSVESLIQKGFLAISLEKKDGKEREIFDLEGTLEKIEQLFLQDEKDKMILAKASHIEETITLCEQGLGRALLNYELETIRRWYDEKTFTHEQIIKAIQSTGDRLSIKYVERILNQDALPKIEIDAEVEEALDEIYKSIK
ncbi:MAG: hypothetical protein CVV61_00025 [Tenericutes bacterium HGW-Tenericutes-6]|jgi:DNA replication protein|nr:MAG: hypothetical protein CVV61_00025 [Tenericutes bacterium HGW-Tenericutes-6]